MKAKSSATSAVATSLPLPNVYLCPRCDKPYINDSSRQRHLRYCGSRVRKRLRSCRACNAAKTKCSFESPCSRCVKKNIECLYNVVAADLQSALLSTASDRGGSSSIEDVIYVDRVPPSAYDAHAQPLEVENGTQVEHSLQPFVFDDPFNADGFAMLEDYMFNPPPCLPTHTSAPIGDYDVKVPSWCTWSRGDISSLAITSDISIVQHGADLNLVAMIRNVKPHAQYNANLIIQALRALPTMMLRRSTFPWFIHSHTHLLTHSRHDSLPEAISTCMSISQMFASRTPETRPFLWGTIGGVYRQFCSEMHSMSQYELLAALQASMVYLTMCIIDQSTESEANTIELLMTLHNLYMLFKEVGTSWTRLSELSHPSPNWEAWIFAESQRRLAHLWFLIGCVVCLKTGIPIDPSQTFRVLSLPGLKSLWEASSEDEWTIEHESTLNLQANGLATLGDLVDAQRSSHLPANAKKLDKWNAGVDNLGCLLNLVDAMV